MFIIRFSLAVNSSDVAGSSWSSDSSGLMVRGFSLLVFAASWFVISVVFFCLVSVVDWFVYVVFYLVISCSCS